MGCYNRQLEKLPKDELAKVLFKIDEMWTDVMVNIGHKKYVVEIKTVDNEKDLDILTYEEFIERYCS